MLETLVPCAWAEFATPEPVATKAAGQAGSALAVAGGPAADTNVSGTGTSLPMTVRVHDVRGSFERTVEPLYTGRQLHRRERTGIENAFVYCRLRFAHWKVDGYRERTVIEKTVIERFYCVLCSKFMLERNV